jgi:pimeloyl-ACP methyl ester carboxylesterase
MFPVRNVLLHLLSLAIFANLSCISFDTPTTPTSQPSRVDLRPCRFPNHRSELLCGRYSVFEDRVTRSGRTISLNIVVAPAESRNAAPDPVFFLAGGPGQGAARLGVSADDSLMRELRRERALVFIDLRGTGNSHPLQCSVTADRASAQRYFADVFEPEAIRACRAALEPIADLRYYTTPLAMEDVEEVRAALGYRKINLYGVSYGTLAALQYLRLHGEHVRSAVLAGVSTPATKLPLLFAKAAHDAMERLIIDCAGDESCRAAFPNLGNDFRTVLEAVDKGPVTFEITNPVSKIPQQVRLSRGVFVERLRLMLYDHSTSSLVPLVIHRAALGDWAPFGKVVIGSRFSAASAVALGIYLTVTCSESIPLITEEELIHETSRTFLRDERTRRHQQACREWPRGEIAPEYYRPIASEVPILMLSGDLDPATPAEFARQAIASLANGRQITLRNTPHHYRSGCATNLITQFIVQGSPQELDATCAERLRRPRFLTELPERYNQ